MKYDFTSILDRRGMDALAVDAVGDDPSGFAPAAPREGFDVIPMWVADMSFPVVPTIQEAMIRRIEHPAFGYFRPRGEYFDAIIDWQARQNGVEGLTAAHIGYENGVLGGVASALNALCSRGESILIHSPTYIGFTNTLKNNGYHIVHSPLRADESGVFRMDLADMERKLAENHIHTMIFCSPHNPLGRVWEAWELESMLALLEKYDVSILSDEIWSDIILPGHRHIPTQSVSGYARQHTVALYAPSKTFNLAGLVGSYHIIYNDTLRDRVRKEGSLSHYNSMNLLSMYALLGAYSAEGRVWMREMIETVERNITYACDYIRDHFPGVSAAKPEGTYMLFVDCTRWCAEHGKTIEEVEHACWEVGVALQDGRMFHGPCHLRLNLALPFARVEEAFDRLDRYVFNIK